MKKIEKILFFFLIFLLPTQLCLHFWPETAFVFGLRIDYLSLKIYLTDVLLFLLFLFWLGRLVCADKERKRLYSFLRKASLFFLLICLNIFFAQEPVVSALAWLNLLKFVFFGFYLFSFGGKKFNQQLSFILLLSLNFFALIGIGQFLIQKTIGGPFYFLGERSFSASTPGIALVNLFGQNFLRAYSTFSHPNSMAGFLVVAALIALKLYLFSLWFLVIPAIGFVLNFSLGATVGLLVTVFLNRKVALPLLFTLMIASFIIPFLLIRFLPLKNQVPEKISVRMELAETALEIFSQRPIFGVGLNNFIKESYRLIPLKNVLNLQPVHNLFLLVFSELGIFGFVLPFLFWIALKKAGFGYGSLALIFVLITGFVDHYWLTLQQNQFLLALLFAKVLQQEKR